MMNPKRPPLHLFVSWWQVATSEAEKGFVLVVVGSLAGPLGTQQQQWWWWVFNNALPRLYNYLHPADYCSARAAHSAEPTTAHCGAVGASAPPVQVVGTHHSDTCFVGCSPPLEQQRQAQEECVCKFGSFAVISTKSVFV